MVNAMVGPRITVAELKQELEGARDEPVIDHGPVPERCTEDQSK